MEISKSLQEEIILVQNKLKNAIRDHQICVGKLNAEPNNSELLSKIQEIQFHIVSLGRCQKQVVERLRKEVELYKADNANGGKVSLATLLGLNNNNHITTDNEKRDDEVKVQSNGIDVRISTRDNYDQFMRNGSILELPNLCAKDRCSSVETLSADEEIIELSNDEYLYEKRPETSEIEVPVLNKYKSDTKQINFLENLGLITANQLDDIQNKKTERKRRSTAKPQFVYSNWDMPTKRKRHSYLQSMGTAPQTRQTTARLNEPSPPPTKVPQKSTSPPTKTISKTLIPSQKSIARPNILRTMQESRAFQERSKLDNSTSERETRVAKSSETKAVHIPGLPSSLTIERIESDTAVCISCRNPGTLTICDTCSANYHISCHTVSSPSPRQCPKCIQQREDERSSTSVIKKDEDIEEKERERYEQRERNSDLRLQVYELEKRSQLLGQSLQLQHRMRQEYLGKQEKTQKAIKRLTDFITLIQLTNDTNKSASTSSQHQPSSSQSPRVVSSVQQQIPSTSVSSPRHNYPHSLSPPISPTPHLVSIPLPISTTVSPISSQMCKQEEPINSSSSSSSVTSSTSFSSSFQQCQLRGNKLQQKIPIKSLEINQQNPIIPSSHNHHHFSSINSREERKNQYQISHQLHQSPTTKNSQSQKTINHVQSTKPMQMEEILEVNQALAIPLKQNHQKQIIITTQCSQAIKSPISSPIVLINHRETLDYQEKQPLLIDSQEDSLRTEQQPITDLDSPPPSSPNT